MTTDLRPPAPLPRLRRFGDVYVIDRCPKDAVEGWVGQDGPASLRFTGEVELDDLDTAAAEACQLAHDGPEFEADRKLFRQLSMLHVQREAEAEQWREHGAAAVERVGVLELQLAEARAQLAAAVVDRRAS